MEYKSFITVSDVQDRVVTGFSAITGNMDLGGDIIHKGAFKKTIQENLPRIRHLWQHDSFAPPIAKIQNLEEVSAKNLPEEVRSSAEGVDGGLKVTREYLQTPRAEEVLQGIISGAISEMSIGYDPTKFDYTSDEKSGNLIRHLREVRLWDTSDVNWGMNPATLSQMEKQFPAEYQEFRIEEICYFVNSLPVEELKAGRVLSSRNLDRLKAALATLSEILLAAEPEEGDGLLPLTEEIKQRLAIAQHNYFLMR